MIKLLDLMDDAIKNNSYTGSIKDLKAEFDSLYKFWFYECEEFEESKKIEEASLSRLYQHTKDKDTFAIIGSQDQDTKQDRSSELKSLVGNVQRAYPNIGFNHLEGTYTYDDGEQGVENSLVIYNIPKKSALEIANEINQESIIWKDQNYFGFLDSNGNEIGNFKNAEKNLTFDKTITDMFGSKLRNTNRAFAFECKLLEVENPGSNFSKQHKTRIRKYPICKIETKVGN